MKSRFVSQWVEDFLRDRPVRANSLIITIYGDMISPHGGSVWLGSFINLVKPLGINDRLVRTSVFRLSKDDWLASEHVGRCSYYGLTSTGRRRFEHAHRRIYFPPKVPWEGDWQIVLTSGSDLSPAKREDVRKELQWEGFGIIAPGVLAHPSANLEPLLDILQGNGVQDSVVVLRAKSLGARRGVCGLLGRRHDPRQGDAGFSRGRDSFHFGFWGFADRIAVTAFQQHALVRQAAGRHTAPPIAKR